MKTSSISTKKRKQPHATQSIQNTFQELGSNMAKRNKTVGIWQRLILTEHYMKKL